MTTTRAGNEQIGVDSLASAVARAVLPEILYFLILEGKVDKSRYMDKEYLISIIKAYLEDSDEKYKFGVIFHNTFLTWAAVLNK